MKKHSKFVSVLGLVTLTLVGCSGGTSSSEKTDKGETKTSVTAGSSTQTPTQKEELVIASPSTQQTWVKEKVESYLKANNLDNTYTVKMFTLGEGDANDGKTVPDWTASTAPDLYAYASDQTLGLVGKGALAEIPSTYSKEMITNMGDEVMAAAKVGTKYYGYPYAGDNGYFLYYNKSVFNGKEDKLEKLDDVVSVCKAAGLKVSYKLADTFFSTGLMFTFGARYNVTLSTDAKSIASVTADFNGANGMKAIKAMQSIVNNADIDTTKDGQKAPTVANKLGATVDGSWNASTYKEAMGDDYACIKLPSVTVDGETKNIGSFLGYKLYGVNPSKGSSTTKLAALHKLAYYLVSEEVEKARFNDLTIAPTLKSVKSLQVVQDTPHVKALAAQSEFSVAQTIVPNNIWTDATAPYSELIKDENKNADETKLQQILDAYNTAVQTI